MKTIVRAILPAALALAMLAPCACSTAPGTVLAPSAQAEPRLITTTGEAEVRVVPDEVVITLGVETWDLSLAVAKNQNDERVKKVLAVTKQFGIEAKYVQTDQISIEPRYSDSYAQKDFVGYFVRKNIVITLKDLGKFEDLLSSALESGVNYVHGVDFRTTELRKYRDQARDLAIKAAQEKAAALATSLGQRVGRPHTITEEQSNWWSWYSWWGYRSGTMSQNVMQNAGGAAPEAGSSIALGQITVNARVSVSFELD